MSYYLVDKEMARTYLFASFVTGDVEHIGSKGYIIEVNNVKYFFLSDFNLTALVPTQKNARVITKKGFVEWRNPSRLILNDGQEEFVPLKDQEYLKDVFVCSNYVCLSTIPQNPMKITIDNFVIIDDYRQVVSPEIEEKEDEEMKIKIEEDNVAFGILEKDLLYILATMYNTTKVKDLIITKGTCLGNTRVVVIDHEGNIKQEYQKGSIYFCY